MIRECPSDHECSSCHRLHHSLLHDPATRAVQPWVARGGRKSRKHQQAKTQQATQQPQASRQQQPAPRPQVAPQPSQAPPQPTQQPAQDPPQPPAIQHAPMLPVGAIATGAPPLGRLENGLWIPNQRITHSSGPVMVDDVRRSMSNVNIKVWDSHKNSRSVYARALLDTGSTNSYCTRKPADQLELAGPHREVQVSTLSDKACKMKTEVVTLGLIDMQDQPHRLRNVCVVGTLHIDSRHLATQEDLESWPQLRGLPLVTASPQQLELLIG